MGGNNKNYRNNKNYIIGIDTGGTFTDVVAVDETGSMFRTKALSTPPDFDRGIINSLDKLATSIDKPLENLLAETVAFCFGTTVATNALWTRSGAKAGMITTRGFEHTHHIARGTSKWVGLSEAEIKHQTSIRKSKPLIPKELVIGVDERIDWEGNVIVPLNLDQVKAAAEALVKKGVESIGIGFLWSISNASHEKEAKRIVSQLYPELYCTYSAGIVPTLGEYERFNNAIVDAYVGPPTERFLNRLSEILKAKGLRCDMVTMKADGGSALVKGALPLATVHSGPAGGVLCAKFLSEVLGDENVITADVGGTSFDMSVIKGGKLSYTREPVLERFSCTYPSLDVKSIGAGGGSLVWVDPRGKILMVGPKSAGALPGPACYGFGGTEPTSTDAQLILGYLDPDYFLGGTMKLYPDKARDAMQKVADQLGMSLKETAAGVYDLLNAHCADLMRATTVQRGVDPRDFIIYAFGGNAPSHAIEWALELGAKGVLVAPYASIFSAMGMAVSDIVHTEAYYEYSKMPADVDRFNKAFEVLEDHLAKTFAKEGVKRGEYEVSYTMYCKYPTVYAHQRVPIPRKRYGNTDMAEFIPKVFDAEYERLYGKGSAMTAAGREILGFEIQGLYKRTKPSFIVLESKGADATQAVKGKRNVYFREYRDYVSTAIYEFSKLQPGNVVEGPAVIEAVDTTVVIPPGQKGEVDRYLNIIVRLG
jgi:N-methylhydantoinase A